MTHPHETGCVRGRWLEVQSFRDALLAAFLRTGPRCDCGAATRLREGS